MIKYESPRQQSAFEAISEAQKLAFSPIAFQATICLLRFGILDVVADAGDDGIGAPEIAADRHISEYGVRVLLDMGLSVGLVWKNGERYVLDKMGHIVLRDEMTRTNFDFVKDVCYEAMEDLQKSIENGVPEGLKRFGDWPTLYPGLTHLREPARSSWFAFDHYYSTAASSEALEIVFATNPRRILDVGGNTGRWAVACAQHDSSVRITIADLPEQTSEARSNPALNEYSSRIDTYDIDMLDPEQVLPEGADTIWMSQFLDCFSEGQVVDILRRTARVLEPQGSLFVMETLWDRQMHEAAAYSLNATSLYFTTIANGTSRMYGIKDLEALIGDAGLSIAAVHENIGRSHTLLRCVAG